MMVFQKGNKKHINANSFKKGNKIGNRFKKGYIPWNKELTWEEMYNKETLKSLKNRKPSFGMLGKKHTKKWKNNHSKKMKGHESFFNRPRTEEEKKKIRLSMIKYINKYSKGIQPHLGKNEKQILDNLELIFDYKIIRQYKCEGYFIDGYIPKLNLVIEIDEKYHKNKKEKDKNREKNIKKKLNCKFLRIKDYE